MKTYFVYKTINVVTGNFYVGVHGGSTDDGYIGSGKILKAAILKYGKEAFKVEYRIVCNSAEEAYELESFIVTEEVVNHPLCYNLIVGGYGGPHRRQRKVYKKRKGIVKTDAQKARMSEIKKNMSEDTKLKMSIAAVERCKDSLTCPHCGHIGVPPNIRRYHFNNCKSFGVF